MYNITLEAGRADSKRRIDATFRNLTIIGRKSGNQLNIKETKKGNEKNYNWEYDKTHPINMPALKEAFDKGILTIYNYNAIKKGGIVTVESLSTIPSFIEEIYAKINKLDDKVYVILSRSDIKEIVEAKKLKFAKERIEFEIENGRRGKIHEYPNTLREELASLKNLKIAEEIGGGSELNGLQSIFKDA